MGPAHSNVYNQTTQRVCVITFNNADITYQSYHSLYVIEPGQTTLVEANPDPTGLKAGIIYAVDVDRKEFLYHRFLLKNDGTLNITEIHGDDISFYGAKDEAVLQTKGKIKETEKVPFGIVQENTYNMPSTAIAKVSSKPPSKLKAVALSITEQIDKTHAKISEIAAPLTKVFDNIGNDTSELPPSSPQLTTSGSTNSFERVISSNDLELQKTRSSSSNLSSNNEISSRNYDSEVVVTPVKESVKPPTRNFSPFSEDTFKPISRHHVHKDSNAHTEDVKTAQLHQPNTTRLDDNKNIQRNIPVADPVKVATSTQQQRSGMTAAEKFDAELKRLNATKSQNKSPTTTAVALEKWKHELQRVKDETDQKLNFSNYSPAITSNLTSGYVSTIDASKKTGSGIVNPQLSKFVDDTNDNQHGYEDEEKVRTATVVNNGCKCLIM